jgi:hypothetical protein
MQPYPRFDRHILPPPQTRSCCFPTRAGVCDPRVGRLDFNFIPYLIYSDDLASPVRVGNRHSCLHARAAQVRARHLRKNEGMRKGRSGQESSVLTLH